VSGGSAKGGVKPNRGRREKAYCGVHKIEKGEQLLVSEGWHERDGIDSRGVKGKISKRTRQRGGKVASQGVCGKFIWWWKRVQGAKINQKNERQTRQ